MFLPKKSKIFENLVEQSSVVVKGAKTFQKLTEDWENRDKHSKELYKLENEADGFVHKITDDIEKFFILPMDKEDLKELTENLDDVIDLLEKIANRVEIYNLQKENNSLKKFASIITAAVKEIDINIGLVQKHKMGTSEYTSHYRHIHDLEEEGDKIYRNVLEDLMSEKKLDSQEKSTLGVMKWKEIFESLEKVLDKCENIAIIFERLKIKYS